MIAVTALAVAGCGGGADDPPGGTERASDLTECLTEANLSTRPADNKEGSSRAFTVHRSNGALTTYAYVFDSPDRARTAQKRIFKPQDKETVAAYTAGDTVVVNTPAAADAQPALTNCFGS